MRMFWFMEEFNSMNLSLLQSRKDRCDECITFEEGNLSEEECNAHRMKARRAQEEKARDKVRAGNEQGVKCVTMDLQSVLLCPRLNASALYYKTKLCVHNFTVYDLLGKHCVCYVWNECEGGLTGNEFASCVVDFLTSDLSSNEYVVYSYGCGYQNRNATLASALSYFSEKFGKTITQNILEKGHTQMEVGSVHSTIERIHCPADYVSIMRESRQNPQPYDVKYSTHDFFLKIFLKSTVWHRFGPVGTRVTVWWQPLGPSNTCRMVPFIWSALP